VKIARLLIRISEASRSAADGSIEEVIETLHARGLDLQQD
jgi:hypothetical protein